MSIGWNILGIIAWLAIVLYLVFIIQNIRRRHLMMIVRDRKRFEWKTTLLDAIEVLIFLAATSGMIFLTFFSQPVLEDNTLITSDIEYQPLILSTNSHKSYYVSANSDKGMRPIQTYHFYSNGSRYTVKSTYATISDGKVPQSIAANAIPYSTKALKTADKEFQKAYVAIYTATYKKNWYNGLALHSGRQATKYYLIRVPDRSFVREITY